MKVLVACEFSGTVRDAFAALGHEAMSCDIVPSDTEGLHYQGNVLDIINDGWDLMIAHPPCTYLCVSGIRWMKNNDGSRNIEREKLQKEALNFVTKLMDAPIERVCIENPISVISSKIRKPDQIIRPFQYGEDSSKATCLWLKNLPKLVPTKIIEPSVHISCSGRKWDKWFAETSGIWPKEKRSKVRSTTFKGIAEAMANQWSLV